MIGRGGVGMGRGGAGLGIAIGLNPTELQSGLRAKVGELDEGIDDVGTSVTTNPPL